MKHVRKQEHIFEPVSELISSVYISRKRCTKLTGSMAVLNSNVPTEVLARSGVKLKYVVGEITTTSTFPHR